MLYMDEKSLNGSPKYVDASITGDVDEDFYDS